MNSNVNFGTGQELLGHPDGPAQNCGLKFQNTICVNRQEGITSTHLRTIGLATFPQGNFIISSGYDSPPPFLTSVIKRVGFFTLQVPNAYCSSDRSF